MFNFDFSVLALWGGLHRPALYDWQTTTVWPKHVKIENMWKQRHLAYILDDLEVS